MSAPTLDRARERFAAALGPGKVLSDPVALREFSDPFAFAGWEEHAPGAAVLPTEVEEVQAVVRIAAEEGVALWTHSTGATTATAAPARCWAAR